MCTRLSALTYEGVPPEDAVVLPLPMKASIRFNNQQETLKAFGDDAVPREFYKIPGSHHIDIWTTDTLDFDTMFDIDNPAFDTITSIYGEAARLPDSRLQACAGPEYTSQVNDDGFVIKIPVISENHEGTKEEPEPAGSFKDPEVEVSTENNSSAIEEGSEGNNEQGPGGNGNDEEPPASASNKAIARSFGVAFLLTITFSMMA